MSSQTLLYFGICVFALMGIGIVLTAIEFKKMATDSVARKDKNDRS
jgi:hypothetical protein